MPRLVLTSEAFAGRVCDLKAEKTTIGRVEDNVFQISEPSVSSHHCEVVLKGADVIIRDLGSTNGTYVNGDQITEAPLKTGQVLRLGNVELRVEGAGPKSSETARDATRGVKMGDFDPTRKPALDKNSPFTKKSNKTVVIFIAICAVIVAVLLIVLYLATKQLP